jgi:hypothetical protein
MAVNEMSDEALKAAGFEIINTIELAQHDLNVIRTELNKRLKNKNEIDSELSNK